MLIFDQFATRGLAEQFAATVRTKFGLEAIIYDDVDKANEADPFPFPLVPPIVHVERPEDETVEREVQKFVRSYDGIFVGT